MANNYEHLPGKSIILTPKDLPMEGLSIEEDLQCEYLHKTMLKGTGPVVNLLNNNCTDAATIIGGLRLPAMDIRKVPGYLSRNEAIIKRYAVQQLHRHFLKCHCSTGATESISVEDYSISYMLGSVSSLARQLHPNRRNEGPLHYCLFNNMNEEIVWNFDSQTGVQDSSHLINAYIHLLEGHKRREVVIQKALEDRNRKIAQPSEKKFRPTYRDNYRPETSTQEELKQVMQGFGKKLDAISQISQLNFPVLPEKPKLKWPSSDLPELPEDD
jgi:hypothetical protein